MTIQEFVPVGAQKYIIKGWLDGEGDPRIDIELRPGDYQGDLVTLAEAAELVRSAAAAEPGIVRVEVRKTAVDITETIVPAP